MFAVEMSVLQYQEDSDFDEAFKHLLQPTESITKIDSCEILQYDRSKYPTDKSLTDKLIPLYYTIDYTTSNVYTIHTLLFC